MQTHMVMLDNSWLCIIFFPFLSTFLSLAGDGRMSSLRQTQIEGEEVRHRKIQQKKEHLLKRDKYLDMTEDEKDGKKEGKKSENKRKKHDKSSTLGEFGAMKMSNHHCPVSQSALAVTAPTFPYPLHFTAEEIAAAPGIEAEIFPEMGSMESLPESHSSHIHLKSSPRCPRKSETQELRGLQTAAVSSEQVMANCSGVCNGPLKGSVKSDKQRKMSQPSPGATHLRIHSHSTVRADSLTSRQSPDRELRTPRARTAEVNDSRWGTFPLPSVLTSPYVVAVSYICIYCSFFIKSINHEFYCISRNGSLSYPTPDFSKVGPRVRFPKDGYKPPKSRRSYKRDSLSPEPPIVFKSPADIVKEVLLNTTDGSTVPSDSNRPPISAPNSIVPQEFRCRQQATTLLEQLQVETYR